MHDALFENQSPLSITAIFMIDTELGLTDKAIRNELKGEPEVRNDFVGGVRQREWYSDVLHQWRAPSWWLRYASLVSSIQKRAADMNI
jgi:hypothetical protein